MRFLICFFLKFILKACFLARASYVFIQGQIMPYPIYCQFLKIRDMLACIDYENISPQIVQRLIFLNKFNGSILFKHYWDYAYLIRERPNGFVYLGNNVFYSFLEINLNNFVRSISSAGIFYTNFFFFDNDLLAARRQ